MLQLIFVIVVKLTHSLVFTLFILSYFLDPYPYLIIWLIFGGMLKELKQCQLFFGFGALFAYALLANALN